MLRNYWYAAIASIRLGKKPHATNVLKQNLVLFRDGSGRPGALLDRCCHRGAPLSFGKIVQGTLECPYHGWRYGVNGACTHIPSLAENEEIPKGAEIPAFPCLEEDGYVWVWIGDTGPDPERSPKLWDFSRYCWHQGSVLMGCHATRAIENNLDWCHPTFTHRWTHGQFYSNFFGGFREQRYEIRLTDTGLVIFAPVTPSPEAPIPERLAIRLDFELPNRVRAEFWRPIHQVIWMHFLPIGPNTCRQEWSVSRMISIGPRARWSKREPKIIAQDRRILEGAEFWYGASGAGFERSVAADSSTLMVRRVLALAAEGPWEEKRLSLVQRRIVTVRA
jgi:phenylpropionate dioxygenase-like ring-hydroxylating dioxygenase large terminal subunit